MAKPTEAGEITAEQLRQLVDRQAVHYHTSMRMVQNVWEDVLQFLVEEYDHQRRYSIEKIVEMIEQRLEAVCTRHVWSGGKSNDPISHFWTEDADSDAETLEGPDPAPSVETFVEDYIKERLENG